VTEFEFLFRGIILSEAVVQAGLRDDAAGEGENNSSQYHLKSRVGPAAQYAQNGPEPAGV
jgi:hypothetical protein